MPTRRDVAWEERAQQSGTGLSGVLFRGFTEEANSLLHAWHCRLVLEVLMPRVPLGGALLDIGCGFGRLAQSISRARPDLMLVGQDISRYYCRHYSSLGYAAIQSDIMGLPFRNQHFAGAMAVTSLMYSDRDKIGAVLCRIRDTLQPGAPLLLIDPGEEMRLAMSLMIRGRAGSRTSGKGFKRAEYKKFAQSVGFNLVSSGGNVRDSFLFAVTGGGKFTWSFGSKLIPRDGLSGGYSFFSLHRWLLLTVPGESEVKSFVT